MIRPGSTKATNNDSKYKSLKIALREEAILKTKDPFVLDCFAGDSVLWKAINKKLNTQIKRVTIDADKRFKTDFNCNAKTYIKNNDLTKFNIIDLDSWGSPVIYLEHIFKTNFKGFIICTYCSPVSLNPDKILAKNYFGEIYEKTNKKSLLAKNIGLMFKEYLILNKITEYKGLISKNKIYCIFEKK
jgi:hypothetical protein